MKPYYRKATFQDAITVAQNIREDDLQEVMGLGHSLAVIPFCVSVSEVAVAFCDSDGTVAGVAGVISERPGVGQIWMLCTPVLSRKPITFVRGAKKWLAELQGYKLLWNLADARNDFHHKLLKMLGFKAIRKAYPPPYYLPYMEIVKLCA